jgi:DNA-binding CsgD family transcriptional regulator
MESDFPSTVSLATQTNPEDGPFVRAVEAIYATALAPEKWPIVLQAIADLLGDVGAVMTYRRLDGRFGVVVSPGLAHGQDEYNNTWHRHDIRAQRMAELGLLQSGEVVTDTSLGLVGEHQRHPFFREFLNKMGLRWFAAVSIAPDSEIEVVISLQRSIDKDEYDARESAMLARIARHAEQALRLGMRLIESEASSVGLAETFARLNMGIVLLDGWGRILFSNRAAQGLLDDVMDVAAERLAVQGSADHTALQSAIDAALRPEPDPQILSQPRPILLKRPNSKPPVVAYVLPLRSELAPAVDQFLVQSRAMVLIIELRAGDPADPSLIRDLLGLTLGEARVAALVAAGVSPRDAALRLGISEETSRTVLKRVFAKSGVSRQSELAALIAKATMLNQINPNEQILQHTPIGG